MDLDRRQQLIDFVNDYTKDDTDAEGNSLAMRIEPIDLTEAYAELAARRAVDANPALSQPEK